MKLINRVKSQLTVLMNKIADFVGKPSVFIIAILLVIIWFICSRFMEYDTWFDIMDVTIFITTFLLLFVVQASQNADTEAIQDKLDEIIDALPQTKNSKKGEEKEFKKGKKNSR